MTKQTTRKSLFEDMTLEQLKLRAQLNDERGIATSSELRSEIAKRERMTQSQRDALQTKACARVNDLVDGILWAVSEIRNLGPGNDRVSDLLNALASDAKRAMDINDHICADRLEQAAKNDKSVVNEYRS